MAGGGLGGKQAEFRGAPSASPVSTSTSTAPHGPDRAFLWGWGGQKMGLDSGVDMSGENHRPSQSEILCRGRLCNLCTHDVPELGSADCYIGHIYPTHAYASFTVFRLET